MDAQERKQKRRELDQLLARAAELEATLSEPESGRDWRTSGYYLTYYATTGFFLGMLGALASLMFNVVGSLLVNQEPLYLIRVYLTFGIGEDALRLDDPKLALGIGCCLYLATGMVLGVPFHVALSRFAGDGGLVKRLVWASFLGLAVWLIMYYGILSWLQPLYFEHAYILEKVPPWVAALTHLVYGWTMAIVYPWGLYHPYRVTTEQS